MGYAVRGECVATAQEAGQLLCASAYPSSYFNGTAVVTDSCQSVDALGQLTLARSVEGAASSVVSLASSYPACTVPTPIQDMAEWWLLGLGVLTTLWLMKLILRPVMGPQG